MKLRHVILLEPAAVLCCAVGVNVVAFEGGRVWL